MSDRIFSTRSNADLGFSEIFLTTERADHISIGHRDISANPMLLLKAAVENATHVMWGNTEKRIVFLSQNVTTGRNRPMAVVVERIESDTETFGKIITASWYDAAPTKHVIWESNMGFFTSFDAEADILYISRGPALDAYAVEDESDRTIWYRYTDADDSHVGVTIFAASKKRLEQLVRIASDFLNLSPEQMTQRLTNVIAQKS